MAGAAQPPHQPGEGDPQQVERQQQEQPHQPAVQRQGNPLAQRADSQPDQQAGQAGDVQDQAVLLVDDPHHAEVSQG